MRVPKAETQLMEIYRYINYFCLFEKMLDYQQPEQVQILLSCAEQFHTYQRMDDELAEPLNTLL